MANPNIVGVSSILGNTSSFLVTTNTNPFATALVNNPAASGKIYKINTILASNTSNANVSSVSVRLFSQDDLGGTGFQLASNISIPASSTLVVLDKNSSIYLLEDRSIGVTANTANTIAITTSWEEIQ